MRGVICSPWPSSYIYPPNIINGKINVPNLQHKPHRNYDIIERALFLEPYSAHTLSHNLHRFVTVCHAIT